MTTARETLIEVTVPSVDAWAPARLEDGSGDVLHMTPAQAMGLVSLLLDAIHDADPELCCGDPELCCGDEHAPPETVWEWCSHLAGDVHVWSMG